MIVCDALDPFFDGELPAAAADSYRRHLADCDVCQVELRGRMLEASALSRGATGSTRDACRHTGVVARVPRRRRFTQVVASVAAAALVTAWLVRSSTMPADTELSVTVERRAVKLLGPDDEVTIGDTLHLAFASSHVAVWVYVDAHRVVLACPGDRRCRERGVDLVLEVPGMYSIVSTAAADIKSIQVR